MNLCAVPSCSKEIGTHPSRKTCSSACRQKLHRIKQSTKLDFFDILKANGIPKTLTPDDPPIELPPFPMLDGTGTYLVITVKVINLPQAREVREQQTRLSHKEAEREPKQGTQN